MANDMKQFGEHLRALRKARGLSQAQLGELASLNDKYLGEVERGEGNPSLEVLMRLAKALDVDLAVLVGDEVTRQTREQLCAEVVRRVGGLPDDELRTLVRILRLRIGCRSPG